MQQTAPVDYVLARVSLNAAADSIKKIVRHTYTAQTPPDLSALDSPQAIEAERKAALTSVYMLERHVASVRRALGG